MLLGLCMMWACDGGATREVAPAVDEAPPWGHDAQLSVVLPDGTAIPLEPSAPREGVRALWAAHAEEEAAEARCLAEAEAAVPPEAEALMAEDLAVACGCRAHVPASDALRAAVQALSSKGGLGFPRDARLRVARVGEVTEIGLPPEGAQARCAEASGLLADVAAQAEARLAARDARFAERSAELEIVRGFLADLQARRCDAAYERYAEARRARMPRQMFVDRVCPSMMRQAVRGCTVADLAPSEDLAGAWSVTVRCEAGALPALTVDAAGMH